MHLIYFLFVRVYLFSSHQWQRPTAGGNKYGKIIVYVMEAPLVVATLLSYTSFLFFGFV